MKLSNLFKSSKYINKISSIKESIAKSHSVRELVNRDILSSPLSNIWGLEKGNVKAISFFNLSEYKIFGTPIDLNNINWHKDYVSGFEYPVKRSDKIKISKWFDKGIDLKFPWEVSRFYFAIRLAQNYVITKDEKYYSKFKELVLDWIDKNPYCYGVNWVCTMEVAIRAINWIVAVNIFDKVFQADNEFKKIFNKSLVEHAEYISAFPEIYNNGHTTNHTTADYTGLLFLALTLKNHHKSERWLKQSTEGLEECIRCQTYEDGINFEASIPYHRLVLEMFAYSAIVARTNGVDFSQKYYVLLFKMFEYTAAYMDHNGNAPQVGDNDSGRILIFHDSDEHDHSYLLDICEHIFDYKFKSQCRKRNPELKQWLPEIEKINVDELNVNHRETDKSIAFEKGGAYFLKNENFSLMVTCFPIGQNGVGGHNHYDMGSFTLSYKGQPIIVDPGSYTYTRSLSNRNNFRSIHYHNLPVENQYNESPNDLKDFWRLKRDIKFKIEKFKNDHLVVIIYYRDRIIKRTINLADSNIEIIDHSGGAFKTRLFFNPNLNICKDINNQKIIIDNKIILEFLSGIYNLNTYKYSKTYGSIRDAKMLSAIGCDEIRIKILIKK